jgi:cation:H+ antiporter
VWLSFLLIALGVALLAYSGNKLVDFSVALAEKARVTPAVIGLTVLAWGTSAPEAFVSADAAFHGSADIALANVVGSNIANVGLILGACALLTVVPVAGNLLRFEYPFLLLASWIALLLCRDGALDRLESLFFLLSVIAFTLYSLWVARRQITSSEEKILAKRLPDDAIDLERRPTALLLGGIVLALAGLGLGARLLIRGSVDVARGFNVSERIIGLTLVALGTSLPELVASIAAAMKRQIEMAVTNIVGSNICNLLLILGVTGLIRPIPVGPRIVVPDMWVMLGMAVLLFPLVAWDRRLTRRDGVALLGTYLAYMIVVVAIR